MQYKSKFVWLWMLVALMILSVSCTRSASTPPPEQTDPDSTSPTDVPITEPTAAPDDDQDPTSDEILVRVYPDVPIADCKVKFLNDYACLLQDALIWVKDNDLMAGCKDGFCPNDDLTLKELYTLENDIVSDDEVIKNRVNIALNEVFKDQTFGVKISRGSVSEVFRLVFYPAYRCEYHNYYTDMDAENIYTCAAEALLDNGLYILEDINTDFKPEDNITRGQFVVMLYLQLVGEGRLQ